MTSRTEWVVETDGLGDAARASVCRTVIDVVSTEAATFECDIPWASSAEWPDDVQAAAEVLSSLREPRRGEDDLYRQTGVRRKDDASIWAAFVTFAPNAFDASVWGADWTRLVAVSDCARSLVVRLTDTEVERATTAMPLIRLRPST